MGEEIYQKALEYAKKKHEGQFRIGGAPFIVHPIAVSSVQYFPVISIILVYVVFLVNAILSL